MSIENIVETNPYYPDLTGGFPIFTEDNFPKFQNPNFDDINIINQYYELINSANPDIEAALSLIEEHDNNISLESEKLANKILDAKKLNQLRDGIVALERYCRDLANDKVANITWEALLGDITIDEDTSEVFYDFSLLKPTDVVDWRKINDVFKKLSNALSAHESNYNNPHGVSCERIGAAKESHTHTVRNITDMSYSETLPLMNGVATVGSTNTVSRGDHKHPTDTSRAAVNHNHSAESLGVYSKTETDNKFTATNKNLLNLSVAILAHKLQFETGRATFPISANNIQPDSDGFYTMSINVSFGAAHLTQPTVMLNPVTSSPGKVFCSIISTSKTGFTACIQRTTQMDTAVQWFAYFNEEE